MTPHHTKDKGDLGVAKAHADLAAKGCIVLFPATEHAPFDLVAYLDGGFRRVQVKYRAARAGAVTVHLRSIWADRNGTHAKAIDKSTIDVVCIYCPDTDECYYISPHHYSASVTLRIAPSRNGQLTGVLPAYRFRDLPQPSPLGPGLAGNQLPGVSAQSDQQRLRRGLHAPRTEGTQPPTW
jgi:hypothetical protein